ncbi:MAG: (2Fe-2S)-binding protein [Candidatus Marinimicrobia bacterium]|nr:(2Fe-2S)-binding protein [Candidatus Neomarinimicrobiota bacterium]
MKIEFYLNNEKKKIDIEASIRLLDVLREDFGLTSVKEGCGEGECGACVVLVNGKAMNSCMIPAGSIIGKSIVTLEGYKNTDRYKAIETGFMEAGSVQCGFCTPGFVMATESLLNQNPNPTDEEIKEGLSGNLCRCTGYNMIIQGVRLAIRKGAGLW